MAPKYGFEMCFAIESQHLWCWGAKHVSHPELKSLNPFHFLGLMHESFSANNPGRYTRKWFSWANSLFAEFVMSLTKQCP